MLPNMLDYRAYKKGVLRDYLEKNIKTSISKGMQEKILDLLAESFDYLYFDKSEYECDDIINLRFDKRNEELYAQLFVHLDNIGVKRSAYVRNLICEYFNQSEYQRERICFNEEYIELTTAIKNELMVQFTCEETVVSAFAVALEYSVKHEHWYLLYFEDNRHDTLCAIPLYKIRKVLQRRKYDKVMGENIIQKIHGIIDSGEFDTAESFMIGEKEE